MERLPSVFLLEATGRGFPAQVQTLATVETVPFSKGYHRRTLCARQAAGRRLQVAVFASLHHSDCNSAQEPPLQAADAAMLLDQEGFRDHAFNEGAMMLPGGAALVVHFHMLVMQFCPRAKLADHSCSNTAYSADVRRCPRRNTTEEMGIMDVESRHSFSSINTEKRAKITISSSSPPIAQIE